MIDENKAIVQRHWEELWNQGQFESAALYYAADFINHGAPHIVQVGLQSLELLVRAWRTAIPDLHCTSDHITAEDDSVVCDMTWSGTHLSELASPTLGSLPPTGKTFKVKHFHRFRLAGGKIEEHWAVRGDLGMLRQFGLLPTPKAADRPKPGHASGSLGL